MLKATQVALLLCGAALAMPAAARAPAVAPVAKPAAPDPARLALGNQIAEALWPNGTYARMMRTMMGGEDGILSAMFDMRATDIIGEETLKKGSKDGKLPPEARLTMREAMRAKDPHFEERMRLTMQVVSDEMARVFAPIEPKMRSGLARAYARRFDTGQLKDIAAFFATPSGKAYAGDTMLLFTDKELIKEILSAMPQVVKQMPQALERVKKATEHLPPPPGDKAEADAEAEEKADETS